VLKGLPGRQSGPFVAWLLRIARNAGEDHRKSPKNRRPTAPVQVLSLLSAAIPGPDQLAADSDTARKLRECLAQLSSECRAVLVGFIGGESYEDLAGRLGIPVGTVRSRLSRARDQRRECLGDDAS